MTKNEGGGGPEVSDEEWARFVREAGRGAGEGPKEPSARARMVTERLRREDEQRAAAGGRGRFGSRSGSRSGPGAGDPPGWRTGPAWQDMEGGRGRGKRRFKAALGVALVAGLALVVVRPELLIDKLTGETRARDTARNAAPLAAETARPSAPPASADPDRPTLKEPFRGSPALQWADGAAGIELPPAAAVGSVSREQVAALLTRTRDLLVASNLDPAVLGGGRPQAALDLLDPRQDEVRGLMERALEKPSEEADPLFLFSRFDPAEVRFHGGVVKTRGRMTVEGGKDGEVRVRADYTFVYPVVRAKGGSDEVARTVVRRTLTTAYLDPKVWEATQGKLHVVDWAESAGNDDCSRGGTGYLHPRFDSEPSAGPGPSGPVTDPYDRSKPQEELPQDCGTVSRT
ncbi:hypothetical protein ABZY31_01875 [Streptomyces sp. NPDC006529]|uniref:hypothetical protein n=1 Tax=Streptomyces sp. NPDC006529 TaxID=3157177 RepID=UPI0033B6E928